MQENFEQQSFEKVASILDTAHHSVLSNHLKLFNYTNSKLSAQDKVSKRLFKGKHMRMRARTASHTHTHTPTRCRTGDTLQEGERGESQPSSALPGREQQQQSR